MSGYGLCLLFHYVGSNFLLYHAWNHSCLAGSFICEGAIVCMFCMGRTLVISECEPIYIRVYASMYSICFIFIVALPAYLTTAWKYIYKP
ncbi:hypothetical protein EV426DRAFT_582768 [Tirmania nivea]|nr:hypothetical protein EV426DRAFT_582768 [Tirmania nivea]